MKLGGVATILFLGRFLFIMFKREKNNHYARDRKSGK